MIIDPTTRFTHRAENYAKYRPHYPQEIASFLAGEIDLSPDWQIADIGSGTGLLSEMWLGNGNTVYAVEPNQDMREMAERLLGAHSSFHSIRGTAEATTLPAGSIDLVSAGSAFHWFDAEKARTEFQRILKPGGYALLAWNSRKPESSEFAAAFGEILHEFGANRRPADHRSRREEHIEAFFGSGGHKIAAFENGQSLDWEGLKGRLLSLSSAPLPGEPNYEPMIEHLRHVFDTYQEDGSVRFDYNTQVYYGHLL